MDWTGWAREAGSGRWARWRWEGDTLAELAWGEPPPGAAAGPSEAWIAPALWDIQMNGRWGISFSEPGLTTARVAEVIRAQGALGVGHVCPTLITGPREAFRAAVGVIARACQEFPDVDERIAGIHLEGPWISPVDGYRGAHPLSAVRDPEVAELRDLWDASGGRIRLLTLAPERPGAVPLIREARALGIAVAIGHTAAGRDDIRAAVEAGARLSTHLGNGIAATLPRHPNPIWSQAGEDLLSASFIADGWHLDDDTLRALARAKGPGRTILVSDASPLAGLPPGRYGDWEVDPAGKVSVAGTPYLAGANRELAYGLETLLRVTGWDVPAVLATATTNPARLIGEEIPPFEAGTRAPWILLERDGAGLRLKGSSMAAA